MVDDDKAGSIFESIGHMPTIEASIIGTIAARRSQSEAQAELRSTRAIDVTESGRRYLSLGDSARAGSDAHRANGAGVSGSGSITGLQRGRAAKPSIAFDIDHQVA